MKKTYQTFKEFLASKKITPSIFSRELGPLPSAWICDNLQELNPSNILEIGRSKGHSLALFKYLWPDCKIVSVDVVYHQEVDQVINCFKGTAPIEIINGDITKFTGDQIFDIVLIDGDHSYQGAKLDWDSIQENIKSGSIVIFDNIDSPCGKVFYDLIPNYKTDIIKQELGKDGTGIVYI
jgi:predicted O-methyltransferase YrrM